MGKIGNWGKTIAFEVSSNKTLTFNNFKRTVSARWHTHNIVNGKPKSEFAGSDSSSVTLEAVLAAERGVRPRATLEKLEKACESGTVDYLYIGGKKVGTGKIFQSTLPRRERQHSGFRSWLGQPISIHAPAEGTTNPIYNRLLF